MQITIYKNFSKRLNSTKRPSSAGTTVNVELKEECTVENPIFILSGYDASIDYIEAFGKYYFVDKKTILDNNRCEYSCIEDYLATGKSDIGATTALIARSSSNYNKYLRDDFVSITVKKQSTARDAFAMPFNDAGCFILSVVNDVASATGYVANYILNATELKWIAEWLSGQGSYSDPWADIETFFMMQFGDIFGCVRSLKWIPVPYTTAIDVTSGVNIRIGKFDTNIAGHLITSNAPIVDSTSIDLSDILPDDFRAAAPYSSVDLYIPYYGLVSLTSECCINEIQISYYIDVSVGDCHVIVNGVGTDNEKVLASIHYDIGVECPIAQVGKTAVSIAQGAAGVIGSALSGNPFNLFNAGIGLISATASNGVTATGALSGRAMSAHNKLTAYVTVCATTSPDDLLARYGKPCMEVLQINTLSGYVQCVNASISSNLTQSEIAKINGMLNEGFYYE